MEDIFIIGVIMSVPITAILSATFLKYKKLELQQGKEKNQTSAQLEQILKMTQSLAKENAELRQRIENLETIVTLGDISADFKQVRESSGAGQELPPAGQENMLSGEIAKIIADRKKFR
ncbi:hypothetical protein [Rhodoflexus caldus]|uniref:hypothetical protein n=1 Tax=Rhodoflexus caldus TaxID=2891236 RepID=UPI00202A1EB7|nr:hypothetical protein [Rhodoflexus caldus]